MSIITITPATATANQVEGLLQSFAQLRTENPHRALDLCIQLLEEVFSGLPEAPEDRNEDLQFQHELSRFSISILSGEFGSYVPAFCFAPHDPDETRLALFRANGWSIMKGNNWYEISSRAPEREEALFQPFADPNAEIPSAEEVRPSLLNGIHSRLFAGVRTFNCEVQDHVFDIVENRLPPTATAKHMFLYSLSLSKLNNLLTTDKRQRTVFTTTVPYDPAFMAELRKKGWYVRFVEPLEMEISTDAFN